MNKIIIIALAIFSISSFCCKKQKDIINELNLKGTWIETSQLSDTLLFKKNKSKGWFQLNRAREINGDYLLPLPNSGLYDYSINDDSISLFLSLSNYRQANNYYFSFNKDREELNIGNFFEDSLSTDKILIFKKILN